MPLLLPPNRTAGGRFDFAGRTWQMPVNETSRGNHLHGRFYDAPFGIVSRTARELTCRLDNDGTLFPFPCSLVCQIALTPDGLCHRLTVRNTGAGDLPLTVGYHTNFTKPACFQVPISRRWETDPHFIPTGTLLPLGDREQAIAAGTAAADLPISGFYLAAGRTARIDAFRYTVSEPFDQWILFNGGGGKDYLSIEPQVGPVNSLNRPGSCPILAVGAEQVLVSTISRGESDDVSTGQ
jgi:aldose 1-epimerase